MLCAGVTKGQRKKKTVDLPPETVFSRTCISCNVVGSICMIANRFFFFLSFTFIGDLFFFLLFLSFLLSSFCSQPPKMSSHWLARLFSSSIYISKIRYSLVSLTGNSGCAHVAKPLRFILYANTPTLIYPHQGDGKEKKRNSRNFRSLLFLSIVSNFILLSRNIYVRVSLAFIFLLKSAKFVDLLGFLIFLTSLCRRVAK